MNFHTSSCSTELFLPIQMQCIQARQIVTVLLLLARTTSAVFTANTSTTFKFLLMVASGQSLDSSTVVSTVDRIVEEINVTFPFKLNYGVSDGQVSD